MNSRTFAFVTGCARSGTTALTRMLNRHPDVAIGFERFGRLADSEELRPELFEPERFAQFSPKETHHKNYDGDPDRSSVMRKIGSAKVIGDKAPQLVGSLKQLTRFPNARLIFILREPVSVANSYDRRAKSKKDPWDTERDYRSAVKQFNLAVRDLEWLETEKPFPHLIVPYEQLFAGQVPLSGIFEFLGVDPARMGDWSDLSEKSKDLSRGGRGVNMASQYVALNADYERYRAAMERAQGILAAQ